MTGCERGGFLPHQVRLPLQPTERHPRPRRHEPTTTVVTLLGRLQLQRLARVEHLLQELRRPAPRPRKLQELPRHLHRPVTHDSPSPGIEPEPHAAEAYSSR